ncbi:alpha/beta hydrolase family protein [Stackebrandtia albiflava]|uniref:Alpha/beta hydrolase family protein n=1 Tax=Stackebrandtia albiflava TaxID=406432 RepID=A0A562VGR0_9ACTN|nr:alpha/beta hydrolase [Stackebrandtia albiflava]TWJ17103.1 alpha/beta hydrolase family protein [Stackebrandtia albiflava]
MSLELWRRRVRKAPPTRVARQVVHQAAEIDVTGPPVLCVTGDRLGAAAFAENWLPHIAGRGRDAYAVSVRGQGDTPKGDGGLAGRVHDLVQTAAALPTRPVVVGHGQGALWVAHAMTRYPVVAAVLLAPRGLKRAPAPPTGAPRVLVAGSPTDRRSPAKRLDAVAALYGGAPLLFSGIGHDFMTDAGWQPPLDALLAWFDEG